MFKKILTYVTLFSVLFTFHVHSQQVTIVASEDNIKELLSVTSIKEKPYHTEGLNNSEWVLIDFVNVVVHVFQEQYREFYKLEELWGDAKQTKIA